MTSPPDRRNPFVAEDIDWREGLLNRIGVVVILVFAAAGAAVFLGFRAERSHVFGIFLVALSPILAAVLISARLSYRIKTAFFITILTLASITAYVLIGYMPGSALGVALTLIAAALLIGRQAFVLLLVLFVAVLLSITYLIDSGLWNGPSPVDVNIGDPLNWYRTTAISVLVWAGLGFSMMFVVNALERNLDRRRAALEALQAEIVERNAAEEARREAEAVASQAQKMEAVGQLAAGIAHDFNNALVVIQGWNEIRGAADADDNQRHGTEMIRQAAQHTAQLSRQLLTFARKDTREPVHLYLDRLVKDAGDSLKHLIGRRVELAFDVQPGLLVHVDESQIQQLLFNLVINSRDAMAGEGRIRIVVRVASAAEVERLGFQGDRWVVIEVEDNGTGIDEETRQHIFEPFFTTKARGKGTGLGLSTVHNIVKQSGGHIEVRSRPGCTVFSVYLPSSDAAHIARPEQPTEIAAHVPDLRTLVLEDNDLVRQMIVAALQHQGNTVVECNTGDEALTLLESDPRPFDLLCTDATFPGARLSRVLEAFEQHSPAAKVLICSGYVPEQLPSRKLTPGKIPFLAKPFTGSRLIEKIREVMQ